jgi:hypothetical protein
MQTEDRSGLLRGMPWSWHIYENFCCCWLWWLNGSVGRTSTPGWTIPVCVAQQQSVLLSKMCQLITRSTDISISIEVSLGTERHRGVVHTFREWFFIRDWSLTSTVSFTKDWLIDWYNFLFLFQYELQYRFYNRSQGSNWLRLTAR